MLENYERTKEGVIKQVTRNDFVYDEAYTLQKQSELGGEVEEERLSSLRLGLMIGSLNSTVTSLLDVGYGSGSFLKLASKVVSKCFGYDTPPAFPLPTKIRSAEDVSGRYYDVVTFFNSLEHMPEIDFIKSLRCKYIIITTPWCHNFSDDWFEKWEHRKPDEHLWHFNDESLQRFMLRRGYVCKHYSNVEDVLRGSRVDHPNYLTSIFKKD